MWSDVEKSQGYISTNVRKDDLPLITSFDGINVFRPWRRKPEWKTLGGWTHVDQGRSKLGFHCVQGLVTITDSTPETVGLVVVPGSHNYHSSFIRSHATNDLDFVRVTQAKTQSAPSRPRFSRGSHFMGFKDYPCQYTGYFRDTRH